MFHLQLSELETNIAQLAMVITADFDLPFQGIRLRIFSKYNGPAMQAVSSKGRSFVNGKVLSNELRSLIVDKCRGAFYSYVLTDETRYLWLWVNLTGFAPDN